jgi:hypothetical protein
MIRECESICGSIARRRTNSISIVGCSHAWFTHCTAQRRLRGEIVLQ